MSVKHGTDSGIPSWIYGWFVLDAILALTPPLHWIVTGDTWVLGIPAALFYFVAVALFICASLIAAYSAEVAAGNFEP
jgi:hypothetical protein